MQEDPSSILSYVERAENLARKTTLHIVWPTIGDVVWVLRVQPLARIILATAFRAAALDFTASK